MSGGWEVQHHTLCGGWLNTWRVDDKPQRFSTKAEAQAAIDEFLAEICAEIAKGEREADNGYSAAEFRVARCDARNDALRRFESYLRREGGWYYKPNVTVHYSDGFGFWDNYKGEESRAYRTLRGLLRWRRYSIPQEFISGDGEVVL